MYRIKVGFHIGVSGKADPHQRTISFDGYPGSNFPDSKDGRNTIQRLRRIKKVHQRLLADNMTIVGKGKVINHGMEEVKKVMAKFEERNNEDKISGWRKVT